MGIKLDVFERWLLNKLCERWEKRIAGANFTLLESFYDTKEIVRQKFGNCEEIDFTILRNDFVGKIAPNRWSLIMTIGGRLTNLGLNAARLRLGRDIIIIIHRSGNQKSAVLTIQKKGTLRTFKEFRTAAGYLLEKEARENDRRKIYTALRQARPERLTKKDKQFPPITIEEYGGIELQELWNLATEKERRKLNRIGVRLRGQGISMTKNFTYNPKTGMVYKVDIQ